MQNEDKKKGGPKPPDLLVTLPFIGCMSLHDPLDELPSGDDTELRVTIHVLSPREGGPKSPQG